MYCVEATVRLLARNRKSSLDLSEIEAFAGLVDPEIDAAIGQRYYWPTDSNGDAIAIVPPLVKSIANYLVAGQVEQNSTAFAQGAEGDQHAYGKSLTKQGRAILAGVVNSEQAIEELEARIPGRAKRAPQAFTPVQSGVTRADD